MSETFFDKYRLINGFLYKAVAAFLLVFALPIFVFAFALELIVKSLSIEQLVITDILLFLPLMAFFLAVIFLFNGAFWMGFFSKEHYPNNRRPVENDNSSD